MSFLAKVTAFVVRRTQRGHDLLFFEHPTAGIQIPAGTVEEGESPQEAALREVGEEAGLPVTALHVRRCLGCTERALPPDRRLILLPTRVYAHPDRTSFDWAYLRRGITVQVNRRAKGFTQITYEELDRVPDPQYVTMSITGWVPDETLADVMRRHFFLLDFVGETAQRWTQYADRHLFRPFWAPVSALPPIIPPQDEWLAFLFQDDGDDWRPPTNDSPGHG